MFHQARYPRCGSLVFSMDVGVGTPASPLQEYLLRYPAGDGVQVCPRIAAGEVVATADLEVCLFNQGRPEESGVASIHDEQSAISG